MNPALKTVSILQLKLTKHRPGRMVMDKGLPAPICDDRLYQLEDSQV